MPPRGEVAPMPVTTIFLGVISTFLLWEGTRAAADRRAVGREPGGLGPVSYTHLDVYKRQDLYTGIVASGAVETRDQAKVCLLYTSRCV